MNTKKMISMFVLSLTTLISVDQAEAWVRFGLLESNNVTMRGSSVSFPAGNAARIGLSTVVSRIYNNPSEAWITQQWGDNSLSFNNGQSEVWFSASDTYSPAVAFSYTNWWTGRIDETDVVFYNGISWNYTMNKTSVWPYGGSRRPFQTTAMHEYGHVLSLGHEDDEYNIMGQDWDHIHCNGNTVRSYLGEDASDGLVDSYGRISGASFEDVSVSLFERGGSSNGYSTHNFCDVYTAGGSYLGSSNYSTFNGQRRYNLNKGTTYRFEYSFENNGETTRTVRVGFYLSSNNYISTNDTLLTTTMMTLGRGNVYTSRRSITLPGWLNSGSTWYIGAIVDDNNTLSEVDGSDNAAYHIVRIN